MKPITRVLSLGTTVQLSSGFFSLDMSSPCISVFVWNVGAAGRREGRNSLERERGDVYILGFSNAGIQK